MTAVGVQRRISRWVGLVGDLLLAGPSNFPVQDVLAELHHTFHTQVAWFWSDPDASFGFTMYDPVADWPTPDDIHQWAHGLLDTHPLVCWYATTGDLTASTLHRVPASAVPRIGFDQVRTLLRPVGLDRQLSIPYQAGDARFRSFLVCGSGVDFDDESVDLARRIQPLLVLLARQTSVLEMSPRGCSTDHPQLLTARERAVLQLLAEGHTAAAIARGLGISTRTAQVHLAHVYRKLGVNDRLRAVQTATEMGYLNRIRLGTPSTDARQHSRTLQFIEWRPTADPPARVDERTIQDRDSS